MVWYSSLLAGMHDLGSLTVVPAHSDVELQYVLAISDRSQVQLIPERRLGFAVVQYGDVDLTLLD